jgi:hypothetical protein
MKRPVRGENGMYMISGKSYKELFGSRVQVHNGTAYKTTGGLTKKDLTMNKWGRIVSEKKHKTAKKEKRLQKYGFFAKKGTFGYVKRSTRKSRSMKGGNDPMPNTQMNSAVSASTMTPADVPPSAGAPSAIPAIPAIPPPTN